MQRVLLLLQSVLAYSSAELGGNLGSEAGFTLYIFYTFSALFLANPTLYFWSSKNGLLFGLLGLLVYVTSFFVSLLFINYANFIFLCGAAVGGIGAGILWPAQGSYFSSNADEYSKLTGNENIIVVNNFAALFSVFYLSFETIFKLLATCLFLVEKGTASFSWRPVVFGMYSAFAFFSVICFYAVAASFDTVDSTNIPYSASSSCDDIDTSRHNTNMDQSSHAMIESDIIESPQSTLISKGHSQSSFSWSIFVKESLTVARRLVASEKMILLVPFQLCFGFSSGLVGTYINGVIVNVYIGDGYIGFLSALITLAAVMSAAPTAYICNHYHMSGKWVVMMIGGFCFLLGGLPLLIWSDRYIAQWPFIVFYFIIHGNNLTTSFFRS